MKKIPFICIPLLVGLLTLISIFSTKGFLTSYPDTKVYVGQVEYFKGDIAPDADIVLRSFKPFYGVVGAFISHIMPVEPALLTINLLFYVGLIIASYFLLKEIGFEERYAAIGSSWVATGYPLLKYGLALLTDISGWFFAAATIAVFLIGIRKNNSYLLVASSVIGFVGSLCKETGVLGLGFAGIFLVLTFCTKRKATYLWKLVLISAPFVLLQGIFLYVLFTTSDTHTSFLGWFLFNKKGVGYELHTLYYFMLTQLSTFSLLWIYVLYAFIRGIKDRLHITTKEQYIIGASLFLATLPPIVWPVFLTRILYIDYLFLVPAALIGLLLWGKHNPRKNKTFHILTVLPIISSVALSFLAGGASLFPLLERIFNGL